VPLLPGALAYAGAGCFAGGMGRNRSYLEGLARDGRLPLRIGGDISRDLLGLLYDSETSGGLLFSVPAERSQEVLDRFRATGEQVWPIGEVIPEQAIEVA
jgi:selenide,water dikinase